MVGIASTEMQAYFQQLTEQVTKSYIIAENARKTGLDPETEVPIPLAKNMAERVVGLISVVAPQVMGTGIPARIIELETQYGVLDWRVGFKIAEETAKEMFCKFETKLEAMEVGIRIGFAYLTLGIVSAPLEGFIGLKLKKRKDGKEYFSLQYAGPIRAAGGTAAATSVILGDYVRIKMGYAPYDPGPIEVSRYVMEIQDYHERVTNLQYYPSEEELKFMVSHLPVEVDGDPTEDIEVSNYKDLPRVETNLIRGGVALVLAEGLTQKAPKLWKRLSKWGKDFELEWDWLAEFLKVKERIHSAHSVSATPATSAALASTTDAKKAIKTLQPNDTFIMDLVAGRPILTHPMATGGFRLRYGRGRTCGMYAVGLNPATLIVLDKFIAIGTQLKVERPRKGASATICDTVDGPIVRLKNGSVLYLSTEEEAKRVATEVEEIIFLGDILFNYGDFSESGHSLVPVGYCSEWWAREVEKSFLTLYGEVDGRPNWKKAVDALSSFSEKTPENSFSPEKLHELLENPLKVIPNIEEALLLSKTFQVPLHPHYLFYWKLVSGEDILHLQKYLSSGKLKTDEQGPQKIVLSYFSSDETHKKAKKILEHLGIPHQIINKENLVLERQETQVLAFCFNFHNQKELEELEKSETTGFNLEELKNKDGLETINYLCPSLLFRDKAGTFIGARMGRPEKAKMRELTGSPQVMFPVGEEGDRLRSFQSAITTGKITSDFPLFYCQSCLRSMIYPLCEECGQKCIKHYYCRTCGDLDQEDCRHGKAKSYKKQELDIRYYFEKAKSRIGDKVYPELIKGVRGTSNKNHYVEHLVKGLLRAKHNIYVNKEGTTRYDATELPLTHFKPKEVKTSVEKLRELGYTKDIYGKELTHEDQLLELKPQDIVLPGFNSLEESAAQVFTRVANFIDELLVKFYKLKPFYNIKKDEDLVGHLLIGLAPHISAGTIGRIIGFSENQGFMAHPMFHAGLRRDCVHPDTRFVYENEKKEIKYSKVGSFVEALIKKGIKTKKIDNFGTLKVECDQKYFVFGVNPNNYALKKKKVKYFIKAPVPKKWIKITTFTKRSFVMTETHDFMYFLKNQLHIKKAHMAKEGDKIILLNLKEPLKNYSHKKILDLTYRKSLFNKEYSSLSGINDILIDEVVKVELFEEEVNSYCLNIEYNSDSDKNILWGEQIINTRCDGDEACAMLLMDALLNFSRQYLPETRGAKSVTPDTIIFYAHNGKLSTGEIGLLTDNLFEQHPSKVRRDGEYEILELGGYETISFDSSTRKVKMSPITKFIRHPSPLNIYEVISSHGKIKVTGDHSVFVTNGKQILEKEVRHLKKGENLVTLGKIALPEEKLKFDLTTLLPDKIYVKANFSKIKIHNKPPLLKKWGNNFYRYINGTRRAPWAFVKDLGIEPTIERVYSRHGSHSLPRCIEVNEHWVRLCAYLIAEGYLRKSKTAEIVNTNPANIQEIKCSLENILGSKVLISWDKRENRKPCARIRLPSILQNAFIALGVSPVRSKCKHLPPFVFCLNSKLKEIFLETYAHGDGHYYPHKKFTMLYTNSNYLAAELSLLAHSQGKKTSISSGQRCVQVLHSVYNHSDPWWPLQDYTAELYGALRKEGLVKKEISALLSNYHKSSRNKAASHDSLVRLISLLKSEVNAELCSQLKQIVAGDIRVERVRKVITKRSTFRYVYDLEVPTHQNFLCGPHPIFAHNTMDAPLVLTSILDPKEVDEQVLEMDVAWKYPLELYEAALEMKKPGEVKDGAGKKLIPQLADRLGTIQQYEGFGFTHSTDNFNHGVLCSAYKTLPSMEEKLFGQMEIARKVRAVDMDDVAKLVIQKHFLKDIKGNLKKFSMQQFRCVKCNEKFRRPPLSGKCTCGGKLIFTITEGSVIKYLGPSLVLAEKYTFSPYLKQTLELLKTNVDHVFGKDKDKQAGLGAFMG